MSRLNRNVASLKAQRETKLDQTLIQGGLAAAQATINKALQYDPATQAKLVKLGGKTLGIHMQQPNLSVYVRFNETIQLQAHFEGEADTDLSGPASAFINLARHQDKQAALMKSDIQIRGSSQLAMGLADVFSDLQIDWEAALAEWTGPVAAHVLGKNIRRIGKWFQQSVTKVKQDTVEFVRDEWQAGVHEIEGEQRFSAIQKLKLDVERIEARIQRLKQTMDSRK